MSVTTTFPPPLPPLDLPDREQIRQRISALQQEATVLRRLLRSLDRVQDHLRKNPPAVKQHAAC
jgi:hypothetical protein